MVFSVIATAVLQEIAARVGLVTRKGLSEAIRESFSEPVVRFLSLSLVAVLITLGNAAYETGNLLGASLGLESLSGVSRKPWVFVIAAAASGLLMSGTYRVIQRVLVGLVVFMRFVFLVTAILVKPSVAELAHGVIPSVPDGSLITILALIGTTVVPYNLFLHASTVQEKWPDESSTEQALAESRMDTTLSVALGWEHDLKALRFRAVWGFVIVTGFVLALVGRSPTEAIVLAQAANALLLTSDCGLPAVRREQREPDGLVPKPRAGESARGHRGPGGSGARRLPTNGSLWSGVTSGLPCPLQSA